MSQLSWRSILQRVEGRRITGLWYGVEDGYLRIELDEEDYREALRELASS